jgi:hypothetical protein
MAKFKGSRCLVDCGGHKAGYSYSKGGGSKTPHRNARSFKKGMKIAVQEKEKRKEKTYKKKQTLKALATGVAAGVTYTIAKENSSMDNIDT